MGGDIVVEAAPGGGSIFWFELAPPQVPLPGVSALPAHQVIGYEGARRTILVADDVPGNRVLAVDMLERLGFVMLEAADGFEAVAQASTWRPDLILMDILMPVLDGLEATRLLRQRPGLDKVPVVAISAGATSMDRERYLAAGLDGFLPKPIDYDNLLACVAAQLGLEWIMQAAPRQLADPGGEMVAPPRDEVAELHRLARIGNMQDIQRHAEHIAGLDARYLPFAAKVGALAAAFQSQALLRFVEACLEPQAGT